MRTGTTIMVGSWLLALALTIVSPHSNAAAADAEPAGEPAGEPDPETAPAAAAEAPGTGGRGEPGVNPPAGEDEPGDGEETGAGTEVFVPSEEISEDFAVSFPVDI